MKTKIFIYVLGFILVVFSVNEAKASAWIYPQNQIMEPPYDEGMGTKDYPYVIASAQQLANLAWYVNHGTTYEGKYFALGTDLDLNPGFVFDKDGRVQGKGTPKQWVPIGATGTFKGNFDGRGHAISGLYQVSFELADPTFSGCQVHMGLFGSTSRDTLCNVNIKNSLISIKNEVSRVTVCVGALAGEINDGIFYNCHNEASVLMDNSADNLSLYMAGLVGICSYNNDDRFVCKIWDCSNSGDVKITGYLSCMSEHKVAGICADAYNLVLAENCSNLGNIVGDYCSGGLFGWGGSYLMSENAYFCNLVNKGDVYGYNQVGGIVAQTSIPLAKNCVNEGMVRKNTDYSGGMVAGLFGQFLGLYVEDCHNIGDVYGGSGISDYAYVKHIYDTYNTGKVEGGCGLFGGGMYLTEMKNCYNTGEVTGRAGLIGCFYGDGTNDELKVENCYNKGKVNGLAGLFASLAHPSAVFKNCYNEGDVQYSPSGIKEQDANKIFVAGLVASPFNEGGFLSLDNCHNVGNISSCGHAAGLSGNLSQVTISGSYNHGNIDGVLSAAGISSWGLGRSHNFWNDGNVKSDGFASGFGSLGYMYDGSDLEIANAYNAGDVVAGKIACGLFYESYEYNHDFKVSSVFNYGKLSASQKDGKKYAIASGYFLGEKQLFSSCYYLSQEGLENGTVKGTEAMDKDDFASGKVCMLLNGSQSPAPWGQDLQLDAYPLLNGNGNPDVSAIRPVISGMKANMRNGYYDLLGRKYSTLNGLKGVFIVNGHKIFKLE